MTKVRKVRHPLGLELYRMESDHLVLDIAPQAGGRAVSLVDRVSGYEYLWRNERLKLEQRAPGDAYDPNFFGGIDELLPNDIPEAPAGASWPDHGELWTLPLQVAVEGPTLVLSGKLPITGLDYQRRITLDEDTTVVRMDYLIANPTLKPIDFLWKLHAALRISPGDHVECPARTAQVVDPAWSRFADTKPFAWPTIAGTDASIAPQPGSSVDFFYLYDLPAGWVRMVDAARTREFCYHFDTKAMPYVWYFASFGGFDGHYTAILEPCTTMPISVTEAARTKTCSRLLPQQELRTQVRIYAGRLRNRDRL